MTALLASLVLAASPPLVQLEFDGRYAAMLSHEPKNYALLKYDGGLLLRGVAFRSSRAEPFGDAFLRRAIGCLLLGDIAGVRDAYVATVQALRHCELPTRDVCARIRLTKTPAEYLESRDTRRELPYEAMLASARSTWAVGDRVRVYRTRWGSGGVVEHDAGDGGSSTSGDPRDYDVDHYVHVLNDTFASRLARALTPEDYAAVFADPEQPSLFSSSFPAMTTVLNRTSAL
jgi:hypothetical protein